MVLYSVSLISSYLLIKLSHIFKQHCITKFRSAISFLAIKQGLELNNNEDVLNTITFSMND